HRGRQGNNMQETKGPGRGPACQGQSHGPYNRSRYRESQHRHTKVDDQPVQERPCAVAQGEERLEQKQQQEKSYEYGHNGHVLSLPSWDALPYSGKWRDGYRDSVPRTHGEATAPLHVDPAPAVQPKQCWSTRRRRCSRSCGETSKIVCGSASSSI